MNEVGVQIKEIGIRRWSYLQQPSAVVNFDIDDRWVVEGRAVDGHQRPRRRSEQVALCLFAFDRSELLPAA